MFIECLFFLFTVDYAAEEGVGVGYFSGSVDADEEAADAVVVEHWLGLTVIEVETVADDLFCVVGSTAYGSAFVNAAYEFVSADFDG